MAYGAGARTLTGGWEVEHYGRAGGKNKDLDKLIADIEASTNAPTLVDLKEFIARASTKADDSENDKKGTP